MSYERSYEPRKQAINVYVSDKNFVCLKQTDNELGSDDVVILDPSQVDQVVKWMLEAKAAAEAELAENNNSDSD